MGRLQADEMANIGLSLEQSIIWHLRGNHFPPVPYSMVQVCIDAIEVYNAGEGNLKIDLPEGVYYQGKNEAPAYAIIHQHHLDSWIEEAHDYEEN